MLTRRRWRSKREELTRAIEEQMEHAIDLFFNEISNAFQPLAAFCATERKRYEPLLSRVRGAEADIRASLKSRLGQPV